MGRFLHPDPLIDMYPGISPYAYTLNNPVKYTDPTGMSVECEDCPDEVYVDLAQHVYGAQEGDVINGWKVKRIYENETQGTRKLNNGYKGVVYEGTADSGFEGEYIFATAGTNPTSVMDISNNIDQLGGGSSQYAKSVGIAKGLSEEFSDISFTGHSLGGGLAAANALATNWKAVTFNAAGLSGKTNDNLRLGIGRVTSYIVRGEALDRYQGIFGLKAAGNIKYLETNISRMTPITFPERVKFHLMSSVKRYFK